MPPMHLLVPYYALQEQERKEHIFTSSTACLLASQLLKYSYMDIHVFKCWCVLSTRVYNTVFVKSKNSELFNQTHVIELRTCFIFLPINSSLYIKSEF